MISSQRDFIVATDVTVLNFNRQPDAQGDIIPPEAFMQFANPVPVVFEHDWETQLGTACLTRVGNRLVAEMKLLTGGNNAVPQALTLSSMMYPSLGFKVVQYEVDKNKGHRHILQAVVVCVSLNNSPNADPAIRPLGDKVQAGYDKAGMH